MDTCRQARMLWIQSSLAPSLICTVGVHTAHRQMHVQPAERQGTACALCCCMQILNSSLCRVWRPLGMIWQC